MELLTYLAQVRQLPSKNAWLLHRPAYITRHSLRTLRRRKVGQSHKAIVIIGIVRDAVWVGQNKSTGVWLKVVGRSLKRTIYFLSQSHAKERK